MSLMERVLMNKSINLPISASDAKDLRIGDSVRLTGEMYVARDAAHKRLFELIERGEKQIGRASCRERV